MNPRWVPTSRGALYMTSYQDRLANIWYYSSRVFPLFVANYYREMLRLPKIGHVVMPMEERKVTAAIALALESSFPCCLAAVGLIS